jgi:AcrR family transcriptional regulator
MSDARSYDSPRRRQQAEQTRTSILAAARQLFSTRGYDATPIADIARQAGVSVPTVYASVGSKPAIARSLVEFIDADVDMEALATAQMEATTALDLIRANARLARVLNERCGDIILALLAAGASDPEVAPAAAAGRAMHREGCRVVVERIHSMGALDESLTIERATAILATSTSPDVVERLTLEHGWSYDEVEAWLAHSMSTLLLAARARGSSRRARGTR